MKIEAIEYRGWPNSVRLSNDLIDLVILTEVGPRIIRYGFQGGDNIFVELPDTLGQTGGDAWHVYGGHRLSHAPQADPRSHYPDNFPVDYDYEEQAGLLRVTQPVEPANGIQKALEIALDPSSTRIIVTHRLTNRNLWPVELAPWALSAMAPGGRAFAPLPPRGTPDDSLLPTGPLALWTYTDMSDPRWSWGHRLVSLTQNTGRPIPQKAGFWVPAGWAAYQWRSLLFLKQFEARAGERYPDCQVNVEFYADAALLEVESLGPLARIGPGGYVEHIERWSLYDSVPPLVDEERVFEIVTPLLDH
jgi:hypothetical protein